jgi:3-isopropylmalate dehydrogenase
VTGGLGLAPSASLSDGGPGLFEPVHGSAPEIAGRNVANPTAMLRSTALLLEHGLGLRDRGTALRRAVDAALATTRTPDLGGSATTADVGAAVREQLAVDGAAVVSYGG